MKWFAIVLVALGLFALPSIATAGNNGFVLVQDHCGNVQAVNVQAVRVNNFHAQGVRVNAFNNRVFRQQAVIVQQNRGRRANVNVNVRGRRGFFGRVFGGRRGGVNVQVR